MIAIIVLLIILGLSLYLIGLIPMDAKILQIIRVVFVVIAILAVLAFFFPGYMPAGMRRLG